MLRDINRYLQGEAPVIKAPPPDDETLASRHAQIVARIDTVKQQWRDAVGERTRRSNLLASIDAKLT
ncbi:hypothetical protein ACLB1T_05130 [Escherichia coli]